MSLKDNTNLGPVKRPVKVRSRLSVHKLCNSLKSIAFKPNVLQNSAIYASTTLMLPNAPRRCFAIYARAHAKRRFARARGRLFFVLVVVRTQQHRATDACFADDGADADHGILDRTAA